MFAYTLDFLLKAVYDKVHSDNNQAGRSVATLISKQLNIFRCVVESISLAAL